MKRYRIQLLGISEAKKKGSGEKSLKDIVRKSVKAKEWGKKLEADREQHGWTMWREMERRREKL